MKCPLHNFVFVFFLFIYMLACVQLFFSFLGQQIRFSGLSDLQPKEKIVLNITSSIQKSQKCDISENKNLTDTEGDSKTRKFSDESYNSQHSKDSAYMEYNCANEEYSSNSSSFYTDTVPESTKTLISHHISKDSVFHSSLDKDCGNLSSGEDYFVAKKPSYTTEQWKNYMIDIRNSYNVPKKSCSKMHYLKSSASLASRRYSDVGPVLKKSKQAMLALQEHRHSADNIHAQKKSPPKISSSVDSFEDLQNQAFVSKESQKKRTSLRNIRPLLELPINIKHFSSSCESGENTTSPNTPSKVIHLSVFYALILQL